MKFLDPRYRIPDAGETQTHTQTIWNPASGIWYPEKIGLPLAQEAVSFDTIYNP